MTVRTAARRTRLAVGVFTVGIISLITTACSTLSGSGSGSTPSLSATSPSQSSSSQPSGTTTAPDAASGGGSNDSPSPQDCRTANLRVTLGHSEGATGHIYLPIIFTNIGKQTCTMVAWPGVSYVTGSDGRQVGQAAQRDGARGSTVTLKPGEVASAMVDQVQVQNYDSQVCQPTQVRGLRIYPPHNTASVFIPEPNAQACANSAIPGRQLGVQSIKPGPGE